MKKISTLEELNSKFQALVALTKISEESIAIITHVNPDGDGLAAALGIRKLMSSYDVNLDIVLSDETLDKLEYLNVSENVKIWHSDMSYNNLVIIDCHSLDRIGNCTDLVSKAQNMIVIDHHIPHDIIEGADYYIDTNVACVGDIVYNFLKEELKNANAEAQKYFAEAIYTTILNDTNNFLNSNVDASVYNISAELLQYGLNTAVIAQKFLYDREYTEMLLIGESLSTMDTHFDGKVLLFNTTREMLDRNNLADSAISKMTQWVKGLRDIDIVIYYWEKSHEEYRFSLRSDKYNVQQIAKQFGGGGHIKASGFPVQGNITGIINKLFNLIETKIYG